MSFKYFYLQAEKAYFLQGLLVLTTFSSYCAVPEDGNTPVDLDVYDFKGPGVALAMYNVDQVCVNTWIFLENLHWDV